MARSIREAYGECARSGLRVPQRDLVEDGYMPGLLVSRDWYEPPHPQDQLPEIQDEEHDVPAPEITKPDDEGEAAPRMTFDATGKLTFTTP